MPNWCYNSLTVEAEAEWSKDKKVAEEEQIKCEAELLKFKKENFRDLSEDDNTQVLTFNGTVPMPETLRITSGSATDRAIAYLLAKTDNYTEIDKIAGYTFAAKHYSFKEGDEINLKRVKILKVMEKEITKQELEEGQKALDNERKYGHKDWYDWSISNWGTKWDACSESSIREENESLLEVSFDTAWAPPTAWLQKVTEKYKRLKFTMKYSEEGMGFQGKAFAIHGEMEDNSWELNYPDRFFG